MATGVKVKPIIKTWEPAHVVKIKLQGRGHKTTSGYHALVLQKLASTVFENKFLCT